jgi:hypothetical protein
MNEIDRRNYLKKAGALSASIFLAPGIALLGCFSPVEDRT